MSGSIVRQLWFGRSRRARAARAALRPLEAAYGAVMSARERLYDHGLLASHVLALPAASVGNLTVGGTGKTPVAAWLADQLVQRGARPAIVLRDYRGDEGLVHAALNPGVPVVTGADRVAAVARAASLGADVAVLDDAFQHRRARRDLDLVLLSADAWGGSHHLLPAGPWREPLAALRRASLLMVTRKAASPDVVDEMLVATRARAPRVGLLSARLAPAALVDAHSAAAHPLSSAASARLLAVAGVADPGAFGRQLEELGAEVDLRVFGDHHRFSASEAERLARAAERADFVVCTLKDAVKLAPVWPRGGPSLWYLSQQVILERGRPELDRAIAGLLKVRPHRSRTVG